MGILQNGALPDQALTSALKPQYWRMFGCTDPWWCVTSVQQFGKTKVTYDLSEPFKCSTCPAPWDDWVAYEAYVGGAASANIAKGRPVDYWDIWNEPEFTQTPGATQDLLLETYKRAYTVIRQTDPSAQIVGPSVSGISQPFLEAFMAYAQNNKLLFDGISWHEFINPESVPKNISQVKQRIKKYGLTTPLGGSPKLHINEYAFASNHLIPGWTVGWLYYLNQNQADLAWTSRACWNIPGGTNWDDTDCLKWLDGLLTKSGQTAPLYWVHRAQAEMNGKTILSSQSTSPRAVALAAKDSKGEITLLVGRYSCGQTGMWCQEGAQSQVNDLPGPVIPVTVNLTNLGSVSSIEAELFRIPNKNLTGQLL